MSEPVRVDEQTLADVRVLIVDDHDLFRSGLRNLLEDLGIPATVTNDAVQQAIGDIPAGWSTAPRVVVAEEQAELARRVAMEFDAPGPLRNDEAADADAEIAELVASPPQAAPPLTCPATQAAAWSRAAEAPATDGPATAGPAAEDTVPAGPSAEARCGTATHGRIRNRLL